MSLPIPIYLGKFDPIRAGDIIDLYLDLSADLSGSDTLSTVTLTVADAAGTAAAGAIGAQTVGDDRVDFRLTAPATAGTYTITAVSTLSDGQKLTHTARIWVV